MNIQPISFGFKQKFEQTKPNVSLDDATQTPSTILKVALEEYKEKQFASMVEQAKQALNSAPILQETSKLLQKESDHILYEAGKIQEKSEEIMAELIDTSAYNKYLRYERDKAAYSSYTTQIKVKDETFDILIGPHRIYATKKANDTKDVFVFDVTNRSLTTYVKNQRKIGQARSADAEYFFDNEGKLFQCNLNPSKGEFELIQKRFKYDTDRKENTLSSISLMAMTTLEDESAERIFEYNNDGQLIRYLRGFKEDANYAIHSQLFYEFDDNNLIAFKKDMLEERNHSAARLDVEYKNENEFSIQTDYDTKKDVECSAICFYDNGSIEGSII